MPGAAFYCGFLSLLFNASAPTVRYACIMNSDTDSHWQNKNNCQNENKRQNKNTENTPETADKITSVSDTSEHSTNEYTAAEKINALRTTIDNLDAAIVHLLAERFKTTKKVGEIKAKAGFLPEDRKREEYQLDRLKRLAKESGLDENIAEKYKIFVVEETKKRHVRIIESETM